MILGKSVLVISFSFEQVPAAFGVLEQAGITPVVWAQSRRVHANQASLIDCWRQMEEKPEGIIMGADVEIGEPFLVEAPELAAISLNCAGYDHLDLAALRRHGVKVCNVSKQNFDAVADLTWGLILGLMRKIAKGDAAIRAGLWNKGVERGMAVSGKVLGIIGLGAIGQAVARRAAGFEMEIIASSTSQKPELAQCYGLRYVEREELFSQADIIVPCCPHNAETHHLINTETLAAMKRTAVVVNPSRGGLVDTEALIEALGDGRIAGAALDVYETEPLFESPLFGLDNTLLTPHMGGLADSAIDGVAIRSAQNMVELLLNSNSDLGIV